MATLLADRKRTQSVPEGNGIMNTALQIPEMDLKPEEMVGVSGELGFLGVVVAGVVVWAVTNPDEALEALDYYGDLISQDMDRKERLGFYGYDWPE